MIILCRVRSGYNATTVKKMMSEIYIMALRVGPKPHKCNVSNHGIAPMHLQTFYQKCILALTYSLYIKV